MKRVKKYKLCFCFLFNTEKIVKELTHSKVRTKINTKRYLQKDKYKNKYKNK